MQATPFVWVSLTALPLLALTSAAQEPAATLVETVRHVTERLHNVAEATAAGYVDSLVRVNGPEEGAKGVHFGNADLTVS
jgi:hypothetical protein